MKKKPFVISDRSGFTLIELIVIISILGVLAIISIPAYVSWMPSYQLKGAARDIYSNLQLAKLEAVKGNTNCTVNIDVAGNAYNLMKGASQIKVVSLQGYGQGIILAEPGDTTGEITFSSQGMATFASPVPADDIGKIFVTNSKGSAKYGIEISRLGTISLKRL